MTLGAQAADPYTGKSIKLVVGSDVGGGFDHYGRVVAKHMPRFIPGSPSIVVQNMPGAGSARAAAYVYAVAPKDGMTIGFIQPGAILGPLFEAHGSVQYDAMKFVYLGSADSSTKVCVTSEKSKAKTFADVQTQKAIFGAAGAGTAARDYAYLLNRTSNAKFDVVSGYKGFAEILLATERGELDGFCGIDWSSLKAQRPNQIRDKQLNVLVQIGLEEHAELNALGVPKIWNFVKDEESKAIVELFISQQLFSRPFVMAPGTPDALVQILRTAFDATMRDEQFLKDAAQQHLVIDPASGAVVQSVVERMYAAPPAIVEAAKKAVASD